MVACATTGKRVDPVPPARGSANPAPVSAEPVPDPFGLAAGCQSDADCALVEYAGCCDQACPGDRRAVYKPAMARALALCSVLECVQAAPVECGKATNFTQVHCVAGTCVGR